MQIIQITNQDQWDGFVGAQSVAQFAQSWDWAVFQASKVEKIWRLAVVSGSEILAVAKVAKKTLIGGRSYFYCDRGPIFKDNIYNAEVASCLFAELKLLAKAEQAVFLRFDPIFPSTSSGQVPGVSLKQMLSDFLIEKTIDIQPKKTAILDLSKSEDELLAAMHQKTRYNIRLAQKKGVAIEQVGAEKFEEFWRLMEETRERDEFKLHGKKYYQGMLGLGFVKLYFAKFENEVIATSIVAHYGDMATYVHGGSSNEHREAMAPFLLQWTAILDAQKVGLKYYDFYGVDEVKWPGVTRFKMGFNPQVYEYSGTHDLVYSRPWYNVYKWLRKVRRKF